jgi:hypothetical protein
MPGYKVEVIVTGNASNVNVRVNGKEVVLARTPQGGFGGVARADINSKTVPLNMQATGVASAPVSLKVDFTPYEGGLATFYVQHLSIPANLLLVLDDEISLED